MTDNTVTTYRLQSLADSANGALMANDLRRAEAAITGMRHVLERHPEVANHDSWVTIHRQLEDSLEADQGH